MSLTYDQASDEMFGMVNQVWLGSVATYLTYAPALYWPGNKPPTNLLGDKFYGRVSRETAHDSQSTLCTEVGVTTNRRYTNYGVLIVEVFCPHSVNDSYNKGIRVCEYVQNTLRGRTVSGHLWLNNVRIKELSIKDMFYRLNVIADYQYDDIG